MWPLSPSYPLGDAQRAVRLVRHHAKEWNVDPDRIGILGFSAGGHLAASASTHFDEGNPEAVDAVDRQSSRPNASILCYPVISFKDYYHEGSMTRLLGENPPEELRNALSLELAVKPETPPSFLWHTADDGAVPVENSLMYAKALSKRRIPFELHVFRRAGMVLVLRKKMPVFRNGRACARAGRRRSDSCRKRSCREGRTGGIT